MLAFFRRLVNSRVGLVITFVVLGLIALAFAAGDVTGLRAGSGIGGGSVAKVGGSTIGPAELNRSVQDGLQQARAQNPQLTMPEFLAGGGFEGTLERLINGLSLWEFGQDQGLVVGKKLVDGQLASYPSLRGPSGKFDQRVYEQVLRDRRLTDAQVRRDLAETLMAQHLVAPTLGASGMPVQLAMPYANLLLERREGALGFIPTKAMPSGAAPTDAELTDWYKRHLARYTLPERRVLRYAVVTPERVKAQATPSDAEIAQAYAAARARYQPTEKRTVTQATVLTQAGANALAAKVRAGTPIAEAARAQGLEARTIPGVEKPAYAAQASAAVADAVFAAPQGAVIGPLRASLGYVVAKVDKVEQVPGRTLAQARDEIAAGLTQAKTQDAIARLQDAIGGAIDGNATFAEIVADQKLSPITTPAITAAGLDPENPSLRPQPALAQMIAAGFAAASGDAPTIVPVGQDGAFAVVAVDRVMAPVPRPLAAVRAQVAQDVATDRAKRAARQAAVQAVAQANKGVPLAQAMAATRLSLPAIRPVKAPRAALANGGRRPPPELVLMFSMKAGTAKLLEAPDNAGWYVVKLDTITPGNAASDPRVVGATRNELGRLLGTEYVQQFTKAARDAVGVKRNSAAIAQVRADLTGGGAGDR